MKKSFNQIRMFLNRVQIVLFICILNLNLVISENSTVLKSDTKLSCAYGSISNGVECVECGISLVTPNVKIVGGVQALENSWPAQVLVIFSYKTDQFFPLFGTHTISQSFRCAGTLITQNNVLTAAHCVANSFTYPFNGKDYTIVVTPNKYYPTLESMFTLYIGVTDISFISGSNPDPSPGVKRTVSKVLKHPSYNSNNDLNDITLLTLSEPVELSTNIQLACLPKEYSTTFPTSNQYSYASGWGSLTEGGSTTNSLYNVRMTIYDKSYCSNVLPSMTKDWNSQICSGEYSGGKDTCQGDSGGGLYIYDSDLNKFILSGITSYGLGCARSGFPGLYTRVSYFNDWIRTNLYYAESNVDNSNSNNAVVASESSTASTATIASTASASTTLSSLSSSSSRSSSSSSSTINPVQSVSINSNSQVQKSSVDITIASKSLIWTLNILLILYLL